MGVSKGGEVRKRKGEENKKTKQITSNNNQKNGSLKADGQEKEDEETIWQTLTSHWLIRYVLPLLVVYGIIEGHWLLQVQMLQNPQSINRMFPFLNLRESVVGHEDKRQLLIVGTMSSGTRQIASTLGSVFKGFEMGHEMSDSQTNFVRDGTVSWIFGIRFLLPPPSKAAAANLLLEFCQRATYAVGFHPRMYRGNICNQNREWSKCWAQECFHLLQREWGCALNKENGGCNNFQPFQYTLHQTRHPLAVIESLVSKFCNDSETKRQDFIRISKLLFYHLADDFDNQFSCLEAVTHHVMEYNRAMIRARQQGLIHGMYQIETVTPCQVAEMAGLGVGEGEGDAMVYPPNAIQFQKQCRPDIVVEDGSTSSTASVGHQPIKPKGKHKINNKHRDRYTWADFEGGKHGSKRPAGDMSLVNDLKELTRYLGYSIEE